MLSRELVVVQARSWVGTPFLHQGRTRYGVDCVGLPIAIMEELGILPYWFSDVRSYGRRPNVDLETLTSQYCVALDKAEPACILLMGWKSADPPSHVAIYTGSTLIHSYQAAGGVVEHIYAARWVRMTRSIWRLPGVGDE